MQRGPAPLPCVGSASGNVASGDRTTILSRGTAFSQNCFSSGRGTWTATPRCRTLDTQRLPQEASRQAARTLENN